jgi:hypothetical protein
MNDFLLETNERFHRDPEFHAAVMVLERIARENGFTPYELKQIAFAAALRVEQTATRIFMFAPKVAKDE